MQATWREANPQYEEMEGVVAGVPELSEFDVIIDAGADASDPENAVPFDVELPGGKVLEQPGNFFFLTETSLFGTNPDFQARGVEPDLDGDGRSRVRRGAARRRRRPRVHARLRRPGAGARRGGARVGAGARRRAAGARDDDADDERVLRPVEAARASSPARRPTSSRSPPPRGCRTSRTSSRGSSLIYDNVQPAIAEADAAQAAADRPRAEGPARRSPRTCASKEESRHAVRRRAGRHARRRGPDRAEAIAGQVSQAAAQLGIELES